MWIHKKTGGFHRLTYLVDRFWLFYRYFVFVSFSIKFKSIHILMLCLFYINVKRADRNALAIIQRTCLICFPICFDWFYYMFGVLKSNSTSLSSNVLDLVRSKTSTGALDSPLNVFKYRPSWVVLILSISQYFLSTLIVNHFFNSSNNKDNTCVCHVFVQLMHVTTPWFLKLRARKLL